MKEKTAQQLVKLTPMALNRYFVKIARRMPQAKGNQQYYVVFGGRQIFAKTPKSLFNKFTSAVKADAKKSPVKAKPDRTIVCLLDLPISKTGVDLRSHLMPIDGKGKQPSRTAALTNYAKDLNTAATIVRKVMLAISGAKDVSIDADATTIQISGPESVLKPLVKAKMLRVDRKAMELL